MSMWCSITQNCTLALEMMCQDLGELLSNLRLLSADSDAKISSSLSTSLAVQWLVTSANFRENLLEAERIIKSLSTRLPTFDGYEQALKLFPPSIDPNGQGS
jgi:hypothetical protein